MNKKYLKFVVLISVLIVVLLFGIFSDNISNFFDSLIGETSSTKIIGQWERDEGKGIQKLEFFSDGTYTSDHPNYNGNYSIDGHRLKLSGILVDPLVYSFDAKDDKLILTPDSGDVRYFTKINK